VAKNLLKTYLHKMMMVVLIISFEIMTVLKGRPMEGKGDEAGMERMRKRGRKGDPALRMQA